jgi:hypothetical protein
MGKQETAHVGVHVHGNTKIQIIQLTGPQMQAIRE